MNNSPIKILVVEDDILAQIVAQSLLQQLSCDVDIATSEDSALEKANITKYHLIFMDIGLGDSDGFTITKKIKKGSKNSDTPVFVLTAHRTIEYQREADAVGMAEFITKPLEKKQISELINKYIAVKNDYQITE